VEISATNNVISSTVADASGGSDTAAGAVLALAVIDQTTSAYIAGTTATTGSGADSITVAALSTGMVTTIAKSAPGGATGSSGNTDTEKQLIRTDAETSDDDVRIAAAVAITDLDSDTQASIGGGATLQAQGPVSVRSTANIDTTSTADGSAVTTGEGATVGAAVALNYSGVENTASIADAEVTGDGIIVEAVMADRAVKAPVIELPVVDTGEETIFLGLDAGLKTGDKITYYAGSGNEAIGGLDSNVTGLGTRYYVHAADDGTVKLYDTEAHAKEGGTAGRVDLTSKGSGTGHEFYKWISLSSYSAPNLFSPIAFDPSGTVRVLNLGKDSGLYTGDVVQYDAADGTAITYETTKSLDGDTNYYIIDLTGGRYQLAKSRKDAFKGKAIELTGDGNTDQQIVDRTSDSRAFAKSGAGGADNGVAGSVAVNIDTGTTSAILGDGAVITAQDGDVDGDSDIGASKVNAEANTYTFTQALPETSASGSSLGLGLSFAIGVGAHDTDASIVSGATVANADDVTVSAAGNHAMITKAKAGAKSNSGTNVGGAAALSVANNNTDAIVEAGTSLESSGDVLITASSSQIQSTEGDADTKGGETGVGVAFAMGWVEDDTSARLSRDVSSGGATAGDVKVEAISDVAAKTVAKGSAAGSKSESEGGNSVNAETQKHTDYANSKADTTVASPNAGAQVDTANAEARSQTGNPGAQGGTGEEATTETGGGTVRAAAAIGATVVKPAVTAAIEDGVTIDANGDLIVRALNDADAETQATGIAFSGDAQTAVGAAVAVNVGLTDATATLGDGTTTAGSIMVESGTSGRSFEFDAASDVDIDPSAETIDLGAGHGLSVGDKLKYSSEGGSEIGGLEDGKSYYVVEVLGNAVKLSEDSDGDAIDLISAGSGTQRLTLEESNDFKVTAVAGAGSTQKGEHDNTAVARRQCDRGQYLGGYCPWCSRHRIDRGCRCGRPAGYPGANCRGRRRSHPFRRRHERGRSHWCQLRG
jgi:hypothetical protein